MLLELLLTATCIVQYGYYTPPEGWTIISVTFQGSLHPMMQPIKDNTVTLRRTAQVGEQVQGPKGCALTSEVKKESQHPICLAQPTLAGCAEDDRQHKE